MADRYEQKEKTWSLFPMSDADLDDKEDFYRSKGWDLDRMPTHSGKLILPDGTLVRIEGRLVEGNRGDFWTGTLYVPDKQPSSGGGRDRGSDRGRGRDRGRDDSRGRDDRSRGNRDDRGSDRGRGRDDRPADRDRDRDSRSRDDRDDRRRPPPQSFDHDLDDDVPF